MAAIEIGRVCVKVAGKDSAKYCIITGVDKDGMVEITGPKPITGIKRKNCNPAHLEPTKDKVEIKDKAIDEDVIKAIESAGLTDKLKQGIKL